MPEITVAPLANYPNQVREFGPLTVQNGVTEIGFRLRRCTSADLSVWPNESTTVDITVEMSRDNGQTWQPLFEFTAAGGIVSDRQGNEAQWSGGLTPVTAAPQRRIRGSIVIDGGPLRSELVAIVN